jgi:hypothetical protein
MLPPAAQALLTCFCVAFSTPTFQRFVLLSVGAILTPGRRTITNLLWSVRTLMDGHVSSYHRVLSHRAWSLWTLGRVLATADLARVPQDQPVVGILDDHATQHKGKKVYGKGKHRDAVRSTHSHTVWLWGHKWVVLCIAVRFPFASRPWALPVLFAFYRSEELNRAQGRHHKTPPQLARGLMATLMHWFPQRKFIFLGDGGFASHELAHFAYSHRDRATLVAHLHPKANLYQPPPKRRKGQTGRPRLKGAKLPSPQEIVAQSQPYTASVDWYGGAKRRVGLVTATGCWYRGGQGLVPIRWVYVKDRQGTHRDEYFFTTDPTLKAAQIVSYYTARWSIEVTFEEARAHLGVQTPRNWSSTSVLRSFPCLMGLFSIVCLIFADLVQASGQLASRQVPGYAKSEPTFVDALATVRRSIWSAMLLQNPGVPAGLPKLQLSFANTLIEHLSYAA